VNEGFTKANIIKMKNGLYAVVADPSPNMLAQSDYFSFAEAFGEEIGREVDVPAKTQSQEQVAEIQKPKDEKWYMPNFAGISKSTENNEEGEKEDDEVNES
jgi:hypothetical protein